MLPLAFGAPSFCFSAVTFSIFLIVSLSFAGIIWIHLASACWMYDDVWICMGRQRCHKDSSIGIMIHQTISNLTDLDTGDHYRSLERSTSSKSADSCSILQHPAAIF